MSKWLRPTDICVVTGGSSGLGAAILQKLAAAGCPTVALDITVPKNGEEGLGTASAKLLEDEDSSSGREEETKVSSPNASSLKQRAEEELPEQAALSSIEGSANNTNALDNVPSDRVLSEGPSAEKDSAIEQFESSPTGAEEDLKPTLTIKCDVRDPKDLARAREQIFEKFQRYASVVVCNAGIRRPLNSIAKTGYDEIEETIETNLSGPLKTVRAFLPDILEAKRGFIVTIGSALGLVCPKGLSVYGASKAGLLGFHEALEQDISGYKDVHALLVCPGQIDTSMFADVKTPSETLAPIVKPDKLAEKIVKRVSKAKTSTLYSPAYVRYLSLVRAVPTPLANLARRWSGVDRVFDEINEKRQQAVAAENADSSTSAESVPGLDASGSISHASIEETLEPVETQLSVPRVRSRPVKISATESTGNEIEQDHFFSHSYVHKSGSKPLAQTETRLERHANTVTAPLSVEELVKDERIDV